MSVSGLGNGLQSQPPSMCLRRDGLRMATAKETAAPELMLLL